MKHLLVIADKTDEPAIVLDRANQLALALSASVHVVYFCFESLREFGEQGDTIKEQLLSKTSDRAKQEISENFSENCQVTHDVVWEKDIPAWVKQYILFNEPDFIVKTGHRSEGLFYTPTDWHLLRKAKAPILLVNEERKKKHNNILACVDLGTKTTEKQELNKLIIEQGKELAEAKNCELHLCYTIPFSNLLRDLGIQYKDELEINFQKEMAKQLAKLKEKYQLTDEQIHIHAGPPEMVILSTSAEAKANLVILGTVGRRGVRGKLIGNTAEKVLPLLKSDVLTLKLN